MIKPATSIFRSWRKLTIAITVLMGISGLLFLCLTLLQPNVAHGQTEPVVTPTPTPDPTSWQKISYARSFGVSIRSIVVDCNNPDRIYLGTDAGLLRSNDKGGTWATVIDQTGSQPTSEALKSTTRSIAISCQEPSTILVGTEAGLLRSNTGGNTWELLEIASGVPITTSVHTVTVDPMNPPVAYVGTWGYGVYKTTNGGDNWQAINEGLTSHLIHAMIIDPHKPDTLYIGAHADGVFKSTNGGHNWTQASRGLPLPAKAYRIAIDLREPSVLYTSMARVENDNWIGLGVYKSTDGGISWSPASNGLPAGAVIDTMAADPVTQGILYVGTFPGDGLYKSTDSGRSWVHVSEGLPHGAWIPAIGIDSKSPRILYAGTGSGELFVSNDNGLSWTGLYSGLPENLQINSIAVEAEAGSSIYLGTTQGVFKSTDNSLTWVSANRGITDADISNIAIQPTKPSVVYAGTSGGQIYRSLDNGQNWTLTWSESDRAHVNDFLILRSNPRTVYAALDTGTLLRSDDDGKSWYEIDLGVGRAPVRSVVEDMYLPDTLYAATWGTGVLKSTDGGQTWFSANNGLESPFVSIVSIDPHTPGTLYTHSDRWGISKTEDYGETWSRVGRGIPVAESVSALVVDTVLTDTLYIGIASGIYMSDDGGDTWRPATAGLSEDTMVTATAMDPSVPGNAYVGTHARGLFQGNIIRIANAAQPVDLYEIIEEIRQLMTSSLGLSPHLVNIVLIATPVILTIILMRGFFRNLLAYWITILFRPRKLFERVRQRRITQGNGFWVYVLCTSGSLLVLYFAFFGPLPDTARDQIWQVPYLRVEMHTRLVASILSDLGLSAEMFAIVAYAVISVFLFFSLMVFSALVALGVGLVRRHVFTNLGAYRRTFIALVFILAFASITSLLISTGLAYFGLLTDTIGLCITMLSLLWMLYLGIVATKEIDQMSVAQTIGAWIVAPFSPLVVASYVILLVLTAIARLPWGHALSLLLRMLFLPVPTIKELRRAPFSTVGDARPYLLAYALSLAPFWLFLLYLRILRFSISKPISEFFGFFDIWSVWTSLALAVSLVELGAQWLNYKVYPIWRKKPGEIYQWGTLFRTLFVVNAAVDTAVRIVFSVLLLGLITIFQNGLEIGEMLSELFRQAGFLWKISLGVVAVTNLYDTLRWNRIRHRLGHALGRGLSSTGLLKLGRRCASLLLRPKYITELIKDEKYLETSLFVFIVSAFFTTISGGVAHLFDTLYERSALAIFDINPVWVWNRLLYQAALFLFLLVLAAVISVNSDKLAAIQTDKRDRGFALGVRFTDSFMSYSHTLASLLFVVGAINIVISIVSMLASFLHLAVSRDTIWMLGLAWQIGWFGLVLARLTNSSSSVMMLAAFMLAFLMGIYGAVSLLVVYFGGFTVWAFLAMSPGLSIPSNPLSYIVEREDLRTVKSQADVYLFQVLRPSRARDLYLDVLQFSKVLRDPNPRVKRILKQLGISLEKTNIVTILLPEPLQLLPVREDIASTLIYLSSINIQDSLDYISASIITDDTSLNWERVEECREAALEALAKIVAEDHDLVFENIASLIHAGVATRTFDRIAQYFPDGLLSEAYLAYKDLLAYEEARKREEHEDKDFSMTLRLFLDAPGVIKNAAAVFAEARNLRHGEEVFLAYDLLSKSIEARFVRDLVAINLDYSQLTSINAPVFPEVIAVLSNLSRVTELLVRSEKADFSDKLPYYAQMVEILDHMVEDMSTKKLLRVEQDATTLLIIPHWKTLLLDRIRELKGRSSLQVALAAPSMLRRKGDVMLLLRNDGNGIAENIRVQVDTKQSNVELLPMNQVVDFIPPRAEMQLAFQMNPTARAEMYRVAFNILYDDLERSDKVVTFADAVVIERGEREFHRLEPIPYVAGPPLRTPEMFVGRDDIFDYVLENLPAKSQDNIILLHGERRTGKTSILYQMQQKLDQKYMPVYVDLQGMLDPGLAAFLHGFAVRIYDTLEEKGVQLLEPELGAFKESPGAYFRDVFLKDITRRLGERRLVLMIDEFEVLEDRVKSRKLDEDIFGYLRHLMQHCNVDFIFAGTYDVAKIAKDYWSVLFNIALSKEIEPLSRLEMDRLVQEPVEGYFKYDGYALDQIWQVAAGHPFFVQLLCRELISYGNRHEISYFTVQDVNNTIGRLIEVGDIHLGYIWEGLSTEKRILLVVLSNLLQKKGIAIPSEIQAVLRRYGVSLDLDESLRELSARGIIQEHEGRYSFKIGLIGDWINATRQIESLLQ